MWIKGTHRRVWIVGPLVFKFPRIGNLIFYLVENILGAKFVSKQRVFFDKQNKVVKRIPLRGFDSVVQFILMLSYYSYRTLLNSGIMENWREAVCYFKTRDKRLAQLYLPLIIVNVYRRYKNVGCSRMDESICSELRNYFNDGTSIKDFCLHTFEAEDNFAYSKKNIMILDYGEYGFQELLEKHGDQIEKALLKRVAKTRRDD